MSDPQDIVIGAKQFSSSTEVKPKLDTDSVGGRDKITGAKPDTSNPPTSNAVPANTHPLEKHFQIQPRTHTGRGVTKEWLDKNNIKVTEN